MQFYVDTVKQMALRQLVAGTPLRTLCLLIAGQPADVFSIGTTSDSSLLGAAVNMSLPPAQYGANGMLDDWEENLAVITANRTKGSYSQLEEDYSDPNIHSVSGSWNMVYRLQKTKLGERESSLYHLPVPPIALEQQTQQDLPQVQHPQRHRLIHLEM